MRHREERSDAAIHGCKKSWIATAQGLAMTGLGSAEFALGLLCSPTDALPG